MLICDLSEHLTYSILDAINNGTYVIFNYKVLRNYNIDNVDYIFSEKSNLTTLVQYLSMPLLYHYNAKQMLNMFRTILDCNKIIEHLFSNIPI